MACERITPMTNFLGTLCGFSLRILDRDLLRPLTILQNTANLSTESEVRRKNSSGVQKGIQHEYANFPFELIK
jgi:hypothetical protein